jgi:EmrB/QacA subfamily drug resistance transporter
LSNRLGQNNGSAPGTPSKYPAFLTVFPSIMLPMFLAVVDQTIIATALPAIAASTGGHVERTSWIVVSYLIAATIAAPIYGRLGDSFGRRKIMFVALPIFIAASLLCAAAPTIELLTLARVLQGLGGGGLMTLTQALIGEVIPPRERARYQGYLAAVAVSANTFGPVAGGYLTEHFGWQSIFLINVPIGLAAMVLVRRLPKSTRERVAWRTDTGGLAFFAIFVVTALLALEQIQHADVSAIPLGLALLAASLVALWVLIRHEKRTSEPLIPITLLRHPVMWRSDAMAAFHGAALVSLLTFLPVYLQLVRGMSPSETGVMLVPLTVGIGTGSLLTGRMVSKTGLTTIFPVIGLSLATLSLIALAFCASALNDMALLALFLWIGLCMGTIMGVVQVIVQSTAGLARLGEAAASVQFSRSIGAAFGTAAVATIIFGLLSFKQPEAANILGGLIGNMHQAGTSALPPARQAAFRADLQDAFRVAFLTIAGFTTVGLSLAATNPMRRI